MYYWPWRSNISSITRLACLILTLLASEMVIQTIDDHKNWDLLPPALVHGEERTGRIYSCHPLQSSLSYNANTLVDREIKKLKSPLLSRVVLILGRKLRSPRPAPDDERDTCQGDSDAETAEQHKHVVDAHAFHPGGDGEDQCR